LCFLSLPCANSPLSLSVIYVPKRDFLQKHTDKLVVIKYYSTSCKACQALAPKYKAFVRNHNNRVSHLDDVVFAEMASKYHGHNNKNDNNNDNNKKKNMDFFERDLQLTALPSIQIYSGGTLLESFACPPNMFPMFKRKVALWMDRRMQPGTPDKVLAQDSEGRSSVHHNHDTRGEFISGTNGIDGGIPLQLSDMFMMMDDIHDADEDNVPRNNIIPSHRSSEFFVSSVDDDDIPLQPSDLFMMMDDIDDADVGDLQIPRNNIIPSHRSSEFFASSNDEDIPLQPSDLFILMDDIDDADVGDLQVPRNNIIPSHRSSEFFASSKDEDIPLQPSDLFMMMDDIDAADADDLQIPRNNIIPSHRSSEFFASSKDEDIPLQPSDLFMMMDDIDAADVDDLQIPRNNIIPSHRSSEFFVNIDHAEIPLQPSDLFMMDIDDDHHS
jgi:thiol-disulfide isomerase/thioredoxin